MSITPVTEDRDREETEPSRNRRSGVWGGLRSLAVSVGQRLRSFSRRLVGADSDPSDPASGSTHEREQQSAPGGDQQPESQILTPRNSGLPESPPPHRQLPDKTGSDTERDGDRLHNPTDPDAYITSDTWVDIER